MIFFCKGFDDYPYGYPGFVIKDVKEVGLSGDFQSLHIGDRHFYEGNGMALKNARESFDILLQCVLKDVDAELVNGEVIPFDPRVVPDEVNEENNFEEFKKKIGYGT